MQSCDRAGPGNTAADSAPPADAAVANSAKPADSEENGLQGPQAKESLYNIGNKQYLFIVNKHTTEELQALLERADEIASTSLDLFDQLEIAMIIHGPSVDLFREKNYEKNRKLIDLAAKLDAFNVIDIKICETSMDRFEVSRGEVPAFIDSVPYAPEEIERLSAEGYINL